MQNRILRPAGRTSHSVVTASVQFSMLGEPIYQLGDLPLFLTSRIRIDPETGCWLFQGKSRPGGYCIVMWERKSQLVHRVVYELLVGPIPEGLVLDHVKKKGCRYRNCCWPAHLEPVTQAENVHRAYDRDHCMHGHEYTPENTYTRPSGQRMCRICLRRNQREHRRRKRARQKGGQS